MISGKAAPGAAICASPVQTTGFLAGLRWSSDYRYPRVWTEIAGLYDPENVRDGFIRPYGGPCSWISGKEKEPSLTLEWDRETEFGALALYLNPDLCRELPSSIACSLDSHHFFTPRKGMPPELVRDFRVEILKDGEWTCIARVRDNWRYKPVCRFAEKIKSRGLRVIFESTYGSPRAEVFEIEIF
jgi:hypothetical protein